MTHANSVVLGLPDGVKACLFDLDGVLTNTAETHAAAWKQMFDGYLEERSERSGEKFVPFDAVDDYARFVDGKPRFEGARSFLTSRKISLPRETIAGLGNRKNELVLRLIHERGVDAYEGSVRYVHAARAAGMRLAVVSSSTNCRDVLIGAGIENLFDVGIDGIVAERKHLTGKPSPDSFLAAARELQVEPAEAAVFEDALAGVAAGRSGGFRTVVGVDRAGEGDALRECGADVVVTDLGDLLA